MDACLVIRGKLDKLPLPLDTCYLYIIIYQENNHWRYCVIIKLCHQKNIIIYNLYLLSSHSHHHCCYLVTIKYRWHLVARSIPDLRMSWKIKVLQNNHWWRHDKETLFVLLTLCVDNLLHERQCRVLMMTLWISLNGRRNYPNFFRIIGEGSHAHSKLTIWSTVYWQWPGGVMELGPYILCQATILNQCWFIFRLTHRSNLQWFALK